MTEAGGHITEQGDAAADDLTVVLGRERFMVVWTAHGLQLHVAGVAAPVRLSTDGARHLADLLIAAADLEEAA